MDGNLHRLTFSPTACVSQEELRQYLAGSMDRAGTRRVEDHLLDCPLCSDAVDGFEASGELQLADDLEDFDSFRKKLPVAGTAKLRRLNPARAFWMRAAAVAAILVAGVFAYSSFFANTASTASGPQLYAQFYTYYKNDIPMNLRRPGVSDVDPNFAQAIVAYNDHNFNSANMLFERALHNQPDNEAAKFFGGLTKLETNDPAKASELLVAVANGGGAYAKKASWYLILCDLKAGKVDEARTKLDKFIAEGQIMIFEAKALREKM